MAIASALPNEVVLFRSLTAFGDLAVLFGTSNERLRFHLFSSKRPRYRRFRIPKASGGERVIAAPPPVLFSFQRKVLACLMAVVAPKPNVHGFTQGRSIKSNAESHLKAAAVLNVDLSDFFPSITFARVYGVFRKHPFKFPHEIAAVLAHLCCLDKTLPQGAPTSPAISNLICRGMDKELTRLARLHKCNYSRYCDDLTFSTAEHPFPSALANATGPRSSPTLGSALVETILRNGFAINAGKSRIRFRSERQEVTGLTVNEFVNVQRAFVRNLRSMIHDCEKRGLDAANTRFAALDRHVRRGAPPSVTAHILGNLAYLRMIRGHGNPIYLRLAMRARRVFGMSSSPLPVYGPPALTQEFLERATWVLLGLDAAGDVRVDGTAFTLCGIGVVSALHTFELAACVRYELRPASAPTQAYSVDAIRSKGGLDLAILTTSAPLAAGLVRSDTPVRAGDEVTVAGFPVWNSSLDELFVARASVTQTKIVGETRYIMIDKDIREGISGGPLLSAEGNVVGIAVYDRNAAVAPNGSLSVGRLDEVVSQPERPPFG